MGDRALYLVAWADDVVVGRATLLWQSKYPEVRNAVPGCCEVNALEATPTGAGVGRSLMLAAEVAVQGRAVPVLGVAVEPSNSGARRFYERLGYVDWGRGPVCDELMETYPEFCAALTAATRANPRGRAAVRKPAPRAPRMG